MARSVSENAAPVEPPSLSARLVARAVKLVLALVGATLRVPEDGWERLRAEVGGGGPMILAVWHQQLFLASWFLWRQVVKRRVPLVVLISRSRDGTMGTEVGRLLDAEVARGSTSRGGGPALRQLVRALARGKSVLLIPDGPRGPARDCKPGVIALAELSGVPLLPIGIGIERAWQLRSWDRMLIPKPFARVRVEVGEPQRVGRGLDDAGREQARRELASELDRLGDRAAALAARRRDGL
jgi:lysophospholipid acyltransferase (LPLAT)-like uncharacterized protein